MTIISVAIFSPSALDHRILGTGKPSDWQSTMAVLPFITDVSIGSILQRGGTTQCSESRKEDK